MPAGSGVGSPRNDPAEAHRASLEQLDGVGTRAALNLSTRSKSGAEVAARRAKLMLADKQVFLRGGLTCL